jgi:hemolysin activation/secretion protein
MTAIRLAALPAALCLVFGRCDLALAQTPPNAGQILRELQPGAPLAPTLPPPKVDAPVAPKPASSDARFMVRFVSFQGNKEIPSTELRPLVADLLDGERNLDDLFAATDRITAFYRERGFAVARAYLPQQEIKDGTVLIGIIEGRIDRKNLANKSKLSDDRARQYLAQVADGAVIRSEQIDRALLLLQDTPGVGGSRATLQPGASVGTSDLLVELDQAPDQTGSVSLDNYGGRYTGPFRISGNLSLNSPFGIGDQVALSLLASNRNLVYARIAYLWPVGGDGLRLGLAWFDTHYRLSQEFAVLDATGSASSGSAFAVYPFIRSQQTNLSGTFTLERKSLRDTVGATTTITDKRVDLINLSLAGNHRDSTGAITSGDLTLVAGRLAIQSPSALAIDQTGAKSNGSYQRISYGVTRIQPVLEKTSVQVALNGQLAAKNLDSSEKFSLGGANSLRAYPQGEATGDAGWLATVELRQALSEQWQLTGFYDLGSVTVNHQPFGAPASNSRRLAGAGFGVNANLGPVQLKTSAAWRQKGGLPKSIPASAAHSPTVWASAVLGF